MTMTLPNRLAVCLLAALAGMGGLSPVEASETVPVKSSQIETFKMRSTDTVFGMLEFIGGLDLTSSNALLGAISAIRFRPDGRHFVAVMDTGHWVTGHVERDAAGKLAAVSDLTVTSMLDARGQDENVKTRMDSEGLAFRGGEILVSYEGYHRIDAYPDPGFETSRPLRSLPLLIPVRKLSGNRSLETLAVSPESGPLGKAAVVVSERSFDAAGNLLAAVLDGPLKGQFSVLRNDPFDVTDGAFLPDGDLLLLERRFRFADGLGMRIRRIAGADIRPGATVDGDVLLNADMGYQIDNMEGMDVVVMPDGDIRVIVVSDDNHSILQRNLMLEFRLLP